MDKNDKFGLLRQMVLNGTSDEEMIHHYYNYPFKLGGALGVLVIHSLAFPAIIHYRNILGPENVMVVNAEDLDVKDSNRLRKKMNEVFKFIGTRHFLSCVMYTYILYFYAHAECCNWCSLLAIPLFFFIFSFNQPGLCPFDIPAQMDEALKGKNALPEEHDISQDIYKRLTKFYIPFNEKLAKITGFNLTHWNSKKPSKKMREFMIGRNTTLPPAWFDIDENKGASVHKGLMQLLPHEGRSEDSGFNTTMGMITMF